MEIADCETVWRSFFPLLLTAISKQWGEGKMAALPHFVHLYQGHGESRNPTLK